MTKVTRLTLDSNGGLERRRLHLREIGEADAPLDTVGQDLRKARQLKGEDIAQISAALKIRKDHLEAIEESEFGALPGRAYVIGFVRTYARYLGLDSAQCVERLKAEIAGRGENRESSVQLSPPDDRKLPQGWLVFAALLLIALAYGGYYLVNSAGRMAAQPTAPVPERLAVQAGLPEEAQAAPVGGPAVEVPAPLPETATVPDAASSPVPSLAVTVPAAPAVDAASLPPGQRLGTQNRNSHVTLRIYRQTRISVMDRNNRVYLGRVLNAGDTYAVPNLPGLMLSSSDAGAVEVIVDGTSRGFAGRDGVETDGLSLNVQDIPSRLQGAG